MSDQNPDTTGNKADNQTGDPSSATDKKSSPVANPTDDKVTLAKEDYQKLISQRDKNFEDSRSVVERLDAIEAEKARDTYIKEFLTENAEKYSFVEAEDLAFATTPEEVEALAKRIQDKGKKLEQKALENIKVDDGPPVQKPEDRLEELEKLKKQAQEGDSSAFERWVETEVFAER